MPIVIRGITKFLKYLKRLKRDILIFQNKLNKASGEVKQLIKKANQIHEGLEELKLGSITVDYKAFGRVRSILLKRAIVFNVKKTIGNVGKERKRLIAIKRFKGRYIRGMVKCYSYRGFRTANDKDRTQGRGIPRVMKKATPRLR